MNAPKQGAYGANDDLVDYILGITFEIWEAGGVDLIAVLQPKDHRLRTRRHHEGFSRDDRWYQRHARRFPG